MSGPASSGVLPVDKPEGPTSHDVVAAARRALGVRRIGHTGTLDPFASGLLLLCVGWATRLAEYLSDLPKTYVAVARLGETTTTDDRTGEVVQPSGRWAKLDAAAVEAAFAAHVGPRLQVPPAFSAKKRAGERAYRHARRGEAVELEPVRVVIHRLDVLALELPDVTFEVECSSGTYVRAIARDVGRELGVGAHLRSLRRTRIGPHEVGIAIPADRLDDSAAVSAAWLPPLAAVAHLPLVHLDEGRATELAHGAPVTAPDGAPAEGQAAVVLGGRLLAIAELGGGMIQPRKVFPRE